MSRPKYASIPYWWSGSNWPIRQARYSNCFFQIQFMGYTQNFRDLYERAAPEMAKIILRSKADGVVLTAGCPLCHRVSAIIQREIEMTGIPTVLITVAPEQSRQAGPPRALAPHHFKMGNSLGGPHQYDLQRKVL